MGLATVYTHYGMILSQMRRGADAKHGLRRLLIVCWVVALSLDTRQGGLLKPTRAKRDHRGYLGLIISHKDQEFYAGVGGYIYQSRLA
jgi:hypothetical protein